MNAVRDLLVIGAGPAGMGAAIQASALGLATMVLDEQAAPGGQIYRALEARGGDRAGLALIRAFRGCGAEYRPSTTAWDMAPVPLPDGASGWRVMATRDGVVAPLLARRLLLATGARERPLPFPGWTLPGVLGAGALQIALKAGGLVPEGRFVLAGRGPLLLLLATQLVAAGARPLAILDMVPAGRWRGAARHLPRALGAADYLLRGAGMMARLRASGIPVHHAVEGLEALGQERLTRLRFRSDGATQEIETGLLAIHDGVVPDVQAAMALGCALDWDAGQQAFRPCQDAYGATSVPGVRVAGDGAGIDGAEVAPLTGRLAALGAALDLGRLDRAAADAIAAPLRRELARRRRIRPLLEQYYAPGTADAVPDEALVCRCEEVTAGGIRQAAALGAPGARQVKAFTRCGMGPCQGRYCGPTVALMLSAAAGRAPDASMVLPARFPLRPVTLAEMASEAEGATEVTRTA
ncbi:NAD(P)/FAD-dependent oxidoreductase [Humitalea sp. 24SJ18S-53]|uniref:FAD/NAD(P)-dependent oxidoreductase n=1 Tax=Humitalea sp. 24SJ18S-53 TaxID=3422307 RepID=UPI003D674AAC